MRPRKSAADALETARRQHYRTLAVLDRATAARKEALSALDEARKTALSEEPGLYISPQVEALLACIEKAKKALETF